MTSLPPGYPGYLPDDGLAARPNGFSEVPEQPVVDALDPHDPLINPLFAGLGGWSRRVRLVITANWRPLLAIGTLGFAVPSVALSAMPVEDGLPLLSALISVYFQAVAWGAVVWAMTQWATGVRPSTAGALAYGIRRSPRLLGLSLLVDLLLVLGTVALVLPGVYLWFATGLVLPAAMFRQERPVGAAFGLFHRFVRPTLTWVALAAGPAFLLRFVLVAFSLTGAHGNVFALTRLVANVVVGMPLQILAIVGLTLTHVEMTARTTPITSASLLAAL